MLSRIDYWLQNSLYSYDQTAPVDQFCTREPYLVGKEVSGFQKYKTDVPFGFEGESHWLDKVNFSYLQIATRSARTNHLVIVYPMW